MTRAESRGPKTAPPLAPLLAIVERLEAAGVTCALGGSGLLAALGLEDTVRDWDLTTDAPMDRLRELFAGEPWTHAGSDALHADQKLMFAGGEVELIAGFAFHTKLRVVRIPTRVSGRWNGVPLGSPEGWAVAYALLGRTEKSERLLGHLERRGADPAAVAALLAQPLPASLAARMAALPPANHFK